MAIVDRIPEFGGELVLPGDEAYDRNRAGVYVNALGDEGQDGVRRAYSARKFARLGDLKRRYDPDNAFHLNQNIRPTALPV